MVDNQNKTLRHFLESFHASKYRPHVLARVLVSTRCSPVQGVDNNKASDGKSCGEVFDILCIRKAKSLQNDVEVLRNGFMMMLLISNWKSCLQMRNDPRAVEASFGNSGHPVIRRAVAQGAGDNGRVATAFKPEHLVVAVGAEAFHGTGVDS